MSNLFTRMELKKRPYWLILITLFGYTIGAMFLSQFVLLLFFLPFTGFDYEILISITSSPWDYPEFRMLFMIFNAMVSICSFLLVPAWVIKRYCGIKAQNFISKPNLLLTVLTIFITLSFMMLNTVFIEWNQGLVLPDLLKNFEIAARAQETKIQFLMDYLIDFSGLFEFATGILMIAVVPALVEEFFFRGVLQNIFTLWFGNIHTSIFVSAIIFGLIHFQFYGLFPRMLLGALFGYLYYWSGSLGLAITGHFTNNAIALFIFYFTDQDNFIVKEDLHLQNPPSSWIVLSSFLLVLLCVLFWKISKSQKIF